MLVADAEVAVIGAGVVGAAVALTLVRRAVRVTLLEAEPAAALAASGTNSGILHTGFDSSPGELETELILRSAELRDEVLDALGVSCLRCGAVMRGDPGSLRRYADGAKRNGVTVHLSDSELEVPGEAVTDPVVHTLAMVRAAEALGAEVRTGFQVQGVEPGFRLRSTQGEEVAAGVVVNCAGLFADEVSRLSGGERFEVYPRKGEFAVFEPGAPLERILLPVPEPGTKGVLVFPTIDGRVVAGPTAADLEDKHDWSVRPGALDQVVARAAELHPPLAGSEPVAAYAGLRPAGRGFNYLVERSRACAGLVNVAGIRSTGLTASLGIAERVAGLVADAGVALEPPSALPAIDPVAPDEPWWRRTARHRA